VPPQLLTPSTQLLLNISASGIFLLYFLLGSFSFHFQIPSGDLLLCKYPLPIPTAVRRVDFPSCPFLLEASDMSDGKHEALPLGFPAPHVSYGLETCRQGWDIIVK